MSKKTVARRQRPPKQRQPHHAWTARPTVTGDVFDIQAAIGLHRANVGPYQRAHHAADQHEDRAREALPGRAPTVLGLVQ
jgi:hypothetical protein